MKTYASVSALAVMGVLASLPQQAAAYCAPVSITQVQWVPACENGDEIQALCDDGIGPYLHIYGNCFDVNVVKVGVGINQNGNEEAKDIIDRNDHFLEVDLGTGTTGTVPATDDLDRKSVV